MQSQNMPVQGHKGEHLYRQTYPAVGS